MMRKKTKKKKPATKNIVTATKKKSAPRAKKELNAAEVRKGLSKLVGTHATKMTKAVISQGETGQLAPVKFLLEMASIYPPATDGSETTTEEESLAQTLLRRLNIPDDPVAADEYEKECGDTVTIPAKVAEVKQGLLEGEAAKTQDEEKEVPVG